MGQVAGRTVGGGPHIVGREPERSRLAAFVEAVPPEGAHALLVRGEPGIGKTTLWRHGVQRCEAAHFTVLTTRAAEEEMPLGMTGLVDLFEHVDHPRAFSPSSSARPSGSSRPPGRQRPIRSPTRR